MSDNFFSLFTDAMVIITGVGAVIMTGLYVYGFCLDLYNDIKESH